MQDAEFLSWVAMPVSLAFPSPPPQKKGYSPPLPPFFVYPFSHNVRLGEREKIKFQQNSKTQTVTKIKT